MLQQHEELEMKVLKQLKDVEKRVEALEKRQNSYQLGRSNNDEVSDFEFNEALMISPPANQPYMSSGNKNQSFELLRRDKGNPLKPKTQCSPRVVDEEETPPDLREEPLAYQMEEAKGMPKFLEHIQV